MIIINNKIHLINANIECEMAKKLGNPVGSPSIAKMKIFSIPSQLAAITPQIAIKTLNCPIFEETPNLLAISIEALKRIVP